MRHVNKDMNNIPESLKPTTEHFFPNIDGKYPRKSDSTHSIRKEMVEKCAYVDSADSHYKEDDVKDALKKLYNNKCAYCEQTVEQFHVEHYRPKRGTREKIENNEPESLHAGYYWLSLSWDNLLLSCPNCNQKKGNKFRIRGKRVNKFSLSSAGDQWENIHNLSEEYDKIEKPLLLNPERSDLDNQLIFDKSGNVRSDKPEGQYTIETCDLNRTYLVDERRKIIGEFVKDVKSVCVVIEASNGIMRYEEKDSMKQAILGVMQCFMSFIRKSMDMDEPFIGFRKQAIDWLDGIVTDCIGGNQWSLILQKVKSDMGV